MSCLRMSPGSRCEGDRRWKQRGFRTSGVFPRCLFGQHPVRFCSGTLPWLKFHPKAREVTAMVLRHLQPSALLPSWDRETLSYSSQPHHPTSSQSLQGPLRSPRAKEKLPRALAPWGIASESGSASVPSPAPLACTQAPLHPLQDHELSVPCNHPRIFPPCLGRVSLRSVDEQTEAERSP